MLKVRQLPAFQNFAYQKSSAPRWSGRGERNVQGAERGDVAAETAGTDTSPSVAFRVRCTAALAVAAGRRV